MKKQDPQTKPKKMSINLRQCVCQRTPAKTLPVLMVVFICMSSVYWYIYSSENNALISQTSKRQADFTNSNQALKSSSTSKATTHSAINTHAPISNEKTTLPHITIPALTSTTTTTTTTSSPTTVPQLTTATPKDGCPFQDLDPFDPAIMKYIDMKRPMDCSKGLPSFTYIDAENKLRVNFTKVNNTIGKLQYCEYTRMELSDENDSTLRAFNWSRKFLTDPVQLTTADEHVWARCFLNNNLVSQTFKGRILEKPDVEERCEADYKRHVKEHKPVETMSVLIVGMDGMSKQNLARTMPKTKSYIINKLNAKELNKFNKVGDNTFPNVIALHTGHSRPEVFSFWDHKKQYFDDIDDKFLWHAYKNAGYRTKLGLDVTWMSAFHYLKKGWIKPPFDYYSRALRLTVDEDKPCRKAGDNCVGNIPEVVVLQDYVMQMVSLFNNTKTKPYFIYNFYTKLTHDFQSDASKADEIYLNLFQQLERKKVLNNTITIFFSDHGTRFGEFRKTFNGKVETNTPFVFFIFPPWFEKKYPDLMETFQTNQNRLTTAFDIHQTLKELLTFKGKTKKGNLTTRAISLFDEIPFERTCAHADIPMEFCNCKLLSNEHVSEDIKSKVSSGLVDVLVSRTKDHRDKCALLSIGSVKSILTMKTDKKKSVYYQVTVTTEPGGGMYEALMKYDRAKGKASLLGEIIRLNLYKGQDACVNTSKLKLYCFCKS